MGDVVYVVTDGEYSGYCIEAVFSNFDAAREYADVHKGRVEQYKLGTHGTPSAMAQYEVFMERDGNVRLVELATGSYMDMKSTGTTWFIPRGMDEVQVRTMARDEQHAIKIASEIRTRLLVEGEWKIPPRKVVPPPSQEQIDKYTTQMEETSGKMMAYFRDIIETKT